MKKIFTILAVATLAIGTYAQSNYNFVLSAQGFTNAQEIQNGDIVNGKLTYETMTNGASFTPKFYTAGAGSLRLYSENATGNGNSFAVKTVGISRINSMKVKTVGTLGADNYGPVSAVITVDGVVIPTVYDPNDAATYLIVAPAPASVVMIKNGNTGVASAQIRIVSIDINYTSGLATADFAKGKAALVKNTNVTETISFTKGGTVQIVNAAGQVVKTATVTDGSTLNVSSLEKGMYIVIGEINGQKVSQKIIKK